MPCATTGVNARALARLLVSEFDRARLALRHQGAYEGCIGPEDVEEDPKRIFGYFPVKAPAPRVPGAPRGRCVGWYVSRAELCTEQLYFRPDR